ncbi:hypothetical protein F5888DRAFT_1887629 [Russula emetica]|nr:hypothetical protein F5888DRAFT_1887629 [Russula emetica]
MILKQHLDSDRSVLLGPKAAIVNPIRQPTAFAAPDPTTSSGPTFYYKGKTKTPIHAAVSADGTFMFCVEGYVNAPELGAGHGGGLTQGLPASGSYKSLFRAGSGSESRASVSNLKANAATTTAAVVVAAPSLHVLAEAAQSLKALSSFSATASPAPTPPARSPRPRFPHQRNVVGSLHPLLDDISAAWPSPVVSTNASSSSSNHTVLLTPVLLLRDSLVRNKVALAARLARANTRRKLLPLLPQHKPMRAASSDTNAVHCHQVVNRQDSRFCRAPSFTKCNLRCKIVPETFRGTRTGHASSIVRGGRQSLSPLPPKIRESPGPSPRPAVVNHYPASARTTTSKESSPTLMADSRSMPGTKLRMITLLIEDRRHGTDELAEVRVQPKTAGEGYHWADTKDVCAALQSGPSRIDGPAKVFMMRDHIDRHFCVYLQMAKR